ncbi:nucleotidyl transferase AbiEii/AbiGii toxin family protein [Tessaracoccus terricola]
MYVVERWLARLSVSPFADDVVLKGGMLLASFGTRRPTIDADALARNMPSDHATVARRVAEIASLEDLDDGVEFLTSSVTTAVIREAAHYAGVRVTMDAQLATAQVKLRLDINFGDPVTPAPRIVHLPALLPGAAMIRVLGYPIETVLAEKLVTAIDLGRANTRMRDFVDVHILTGTQTVRCGELRAAVEATAAFRSVALTPLAHAASGLGTLRATTYAAYRKGLGSTVHGLPQRFVDAIAGVVAFIDPVIEGLGAGAVWDPSTRQWKPEGASPSPLDSWPRTG